MNNDGRLPEDGIITVSATGTVRVGASVGLLVTLGDEALSKAIGAMTPEILADQRGIFESALQSEGTDPARAADYRRILTAITKEEVRRAMETFNAHIPERPLDSGGQPYPVPAVIVPDGKRMNATTKWNRYGQFIINWDYELRSKGMSSASGRAEEIGRLLTDKFQLDTSTFTSTQLGRVRRAHQEGRLRL